VVGVGMAFVSLAIRTDHLIIHVPLHWEIGNMPNVQVNYYYPDEVIGLNDTIQKRFLYIRRSGS
jgi:hypothetical protein